MAFFSISVKALKPSGKEFDLVCFQHHIKMVISIMMQARFALLVCISNCLHESMRYCQRSVTVMLRDRRLPQSWPPAGRLNRQWQLPLHRHVSIPTLLLPYTVHMDDDPGQSHIVTVSYCQSYIIQWWAVSLEHCPVKHNLFLADYLRGHSSVT